MDENRAPETYYLYVTNKGIVMDDIPIHVVSSCNLDIYTFPFDIQNCTFTFNSYKLYGKLAWMKGTFSLSTEASNLSFVVVLLFSTVEDIQMFFAEPVDITLRNSLDVMTTKGEWELIKMLSEKNVLLMDNLNTSFDLLIYHVRP